MLQSSFDCSVDGAEQLGMLYLSFRWIQIGKTPSRRAKEGDLGVLQAIGGTTMPKKFVKVHGYEASLSGIPKTRLSSFHWERLGLCACSC